MQVYLPLATLDMKTDRGSTSNRPLRLQNWRFGPSLVFPFRARSGQDGCEIGVPCLPGCHTFEFTHGAEARQDPR